MFDHYRRDAMEEKDNREVEYIIPIAEFSSLSKREQHTLNMLYYSVMESLLFNNTERFAGAGLKEDTEDAK